MESYACFANTRGTLHRAVSKLSAVRRQVWQTCLRPRLGTQPKHGPDPNLTSQTVTSEEVCARVSLTEHRD